MFRMPFTVEKVMNVRSSDREKFLERVSEAVAAAIADMPMSIVAITNDSNVKINLYVFDSTPLLFEIAAEGTLYPTVYLTWLTSEACPIIYVGKRYLEFVQKGSDTVVPQNSGPRRLPTIEEERPAALSLVMNDAEIKGPVVVGRALMPSNNMIANAMPMHERGMQVLHFYGDALWHFGPETPAPIRGPEIQTELETREEAFPTLAENIASAKKFIADIPQMKDFNSVAGECRILSVEEGRVRVEFDVNEDQVNSEGTLHGGCTSTLADVFTTVALIATPRGARGVTVDLHVSCTEAAKLGETIVIDSTVIKTSPSMAHMRADFYRKSDNKAIALCLHTKAFAQERSA